MPQSTKDAIIINAFIVGVYILSIALILFMAIPLTHYAWKWWTS